MLSIFWENKAGHLGNLKLNKFTFIISLLTITFNSLAQQDSSNDLSALFELTKLNRGLNSKYDDAAPILSPDGKTLYFFISNHPENNFGKENTQDIWYSERKEDGTWGNAIHMSSPFNAYRFNQIMTVLPDNNTVLIRGGGKKNLKLFSLVKRVSGKWQKPQTVKVQDYEEMNKGVFSGAYLSKDQSVLFLYFSETKGKIFSDIYVSKKIEEGLYSRPKKLPEGINSYKDDFGPYISPDQKMLYFASNRPGGLGKSDLYVSERLDDTWEKWSEPKNLGVPINTKIFDAYISFSEDQQNGFTTRTWKTQDGGHMDIWGITPKVIPPIKLEFIGNTFSEATEEESEYPIKSQISITSHLSKRSKTIESDSLEGYFETLLDTLGYYTIDIRAEGFLPQKDTIQFETMEIDDIIEETYFLKKLSKGVTVKLENIFFDFDKSTLRPESIVELENLLSIMEDSPNLIIQIEGHTDSKGNDDYNERLSQGRAEAVMNYLLENDVDQARVSAVGFGEARPIATNETDEGRQLNRRVVFTVQ